MTDMTTLLARWQLDVSNVRAKLYRAETPRKQDRWHAIWFFAQGWSAAQVAEALGCHLHTLGAWLDEVGRTDPAGLAFEQTVGSLTSQEAV